MTDRKGLKYIKDFDGISYYSFSPKLGKWYYEDYPEYRKHSRSHNIRMFIEFIDGGYEVIYLVEEDKVVGYFIISKGGTRLRCAGREDIVIGPGKINRSLRGKRYGTKGLYAILHELGLKYKNAYAFIKPTNAPSLAMVKNLGFEVIGSGSSKGLLKRINNDGGQEFVLFRYTPGGKEEGNGLDES